MLPGFYDLALTAYEQDFLPYLQQITQEVESSIDGIRAFLAPEIKRFDEDGIDLTVYGVDSASRTIQFGEIQVAIGCGYNVASDSAQPPECYFKLHVGSNAEGFSVVSGYLRFCADISLLANSGDRLTFYDGSFQSLNFDANKFAKTALSDFGNEEIERLCVEKVASVDSPYFTVINPDRKNLIAMSKKGVSSHLFNRIQQRQKLGELSDISLTIALTDKTLFDLVLAPGEYHIRPLREDKGLKHSIANETQQQIKRDRGESALKAVIRQQENFFSDSLRVIYFKPWEWSSALRVECHKQADLRTVLGVVKHQTRIRSVFEPIPLFLADSLSKQSMSADLLFGAANLSKFPALFKPSRTGNI